ncbi:hypothetical protein EMIHUDRAFT_414292 [Emiliania huxleyi CCMP1516]|uniref:Proteasome activator PA28 C-terminal domain-containing protein n=2 Tax=Emiliania huxleyi TaxID=2903 RepID=A0A0D3I0J6_EMIH1|nr:hypothetical protein EMIHUDRAFT_414292 [Emiliania huxleyi CCMP1516]EOD04781.1 hypothetical protein EMIHUDRAFT_414292 [Emiliania huxleyi CCMP1516]|mmetsp:Transcript_22893/g.65445  ORF Transcript_22893/g.65445 Transcript_22893/m.65445 type:complete len:248 (+) Transcript_22893:47-790(+)|eukprot:XP_005757210.1 hypothetical protein EMIHUDRAFT_414292 [Emiliania huxleyi CCMP1516]
MAETELEALALQEADKVVTETLNARAAALAQLVVQACPPKPLSELEESYKACGSGTNKAVAGLLRTVREEAAAAVDHLKQAELWLILKAPAVSDGNNFGVEVQAFVLGELKALRTGFSAMVALPAEYHQARAQGLEKVAQDSSKDHDESSTTETETSTEEGKTKEKKVVKTVNKCSQGSKSKPTLADYEDYTAALDVKHYHLGKEALVDLRNGYMKAAALFNKNLKRLSDPRGEASGGGYKNTMSMF